MKIGRNKDAKIDDRRTSVWALSKLSNRTVAKFLARIFVSEADTGLIWEAAKGLSNNPKGTHYPLLVRCLKVSKSPVRREAAAYCLGWLMNKRYASFLLSTLRNQEELPRIRGQAAESLGILKYKKSVPGLIRALSDQSEEVRFWAAYALGELNDKKAIPHLKRLAKTDKSKLRGWWSLAKEARDAIKSIEEGNSLG